jgi:hypothetical protein
MSERPHGQAGSGDGRSQSSGAADTQPSPPPVARQSDVFSAVVVVGALILGILIVAAVAAGWLK